jgi:omega-6 fatty acid desaturase (delta-12 desaturase)
MTGAQWRQIAGQLDSQGGSPLSSTVLLLDLALLVSAALLSARGALGAVAAVLPLTLVLLHFYLLHHEAVHKALFRWPLLNQAAGHALGWILAFPFLPRQRSDTLHHIWTGHPTGDPANDRAIRRFGDLSPRAAATLEWAWRTWLPVLVINDVVGLWREPFVQLEHKPQSPRFKREARWAQAYVAGYVLAGFTLWQASLLLRFATVFLPALFLTWMLQELLNLPHHAETPLIDSEKPLPFWRQHLVTHACATVPLWSSMIILHFNLHVAHHAFPWLPWYRLPLAQALIEQCDPALAVVQSNELKWSWVRRRQRRFLEVMGHYFIVEARKRSLLRPAASSAGGRS